MALQTTIATLAAYDAGILFDKSSQDSIPEMGFIFPFVFMEKQGGTINNPSEIFFLNIEKSERTFIYSELLSQIEKLTYLEGNWNSYGAPKPEKKAIDNAESILKTITELKIFPAKILPSAEGGISILFVKDNKYADIECDNEGDIIAGMSDRQGNRDFWEVQKEEALYELTLKRIHTFLNT